MVPLPSAAMGSIVCARIHVLAIVGSCHPRGVYPHARGVL